MFDLQELFVGKRQCLTLFIYLFYLFIWCLTLFIFSISIYLSCEAKFRTRIRIFVKRTFSTASTFDMRGAQKAQPFGNPLDGRVRPRALLNVLGCVAHRRPLRLASR